jgi:rhodanese-related sulfurtransferase
MAAKTNYAGDVTPRAAWTTLAQDATALLIDTRTQPEWSFVGLPDLSSLGKSVLKVSWQIYPTMTVDTDFVAKVKAQVPADPGTPLFFLCRSGARSRAASIAMTQAGFTRCFNIVGGFEGDKSNQNRRGAVNGWKVDNLPWSQE